MIAGMRSLPGTLALLTLANLACGDGESTFSIPFSATVSGQAISCAQPATLGGRSVEVRDFRLFVSNVELMGADGARVPLTLTQDGQWQDGEVALLDFEDGTGSCSETGNAPTHTTIDGVADIDNPTGIRLEIGIPFARNHFETASQPAPLNIASMFWNWRGGYKFIRIDLRDGTTPFNVHLGSTACDAASAVEAPTRCDRSNRPVLMLSDVSFERGVELDLANLLAGADTSTNTAMTPPGCQSSPTEADDCRPIFNNLGLDFASGQCAAADCMGQSFARAL